MSKNHDTLAIRALVLSVFMTNGRLVDAGMGANGAPDKVAMDKSGANKAAIDAINAGRAAPILVLQVNILTRSLSRTIAPSGG